MNTLSMGKYRALGRATNSDGIFSILALDHQDSLKWAMNKENPQSVTSVAMIDLKQRVVSALIEDVTGVLLDPIYGAGQAVTANLFTNKALLVELERADYMLEPLPVDIGIDPDWHVKSIKMMGAEGVKLFYYYNPNDTEHAQRQDSVIAQIVADCTTYDIPLYAEPIFRRMSADESKTEAVIESAKRAETLGADILKLEFPVDVHAEPDTALWMEACSALSDAVSIPWVLLSAGVDYNTFTQQLEIACKAGASGFIVGRALWGDVTAFSDDEQQAWLSSVGHERLHELRTIAEQHATGWHRFYAPPTVTTEWYRDYDRRHHD